MRALGEFAAMSCAAVCLGAWRFIFWAPTRKLGCRLIVLTMLAPWPAAARLGETVAQCNARYGQGHTASSWSESLPPGVIKMRYHTKGGQIGIIATFVNGRCQVITYELDSRRNFTPEEKQQLQELYATLWLENEKWERDELLSHLSRRSVWAVTQDRKIYFFDETPLRHVTFCTSAWLAYEQRLKRADEVRKAQKAAHVLDGV